MYVCCMYVCMYVRMYVHVRYVFADISEAANSVDITAFLRQSSYTVFFTSFYLSYICLLNL